MRRKVMHWLEDHQLALFRVLFGGYFFINFWRLLPWAQSLYGDAGALPNPQMNPTAAFLPDWIHAWSTGSGPEMMLYALMGLSLCVMLGFRARIASFVMWIGWALLWHRNVFTLNPSMPFNGFLMLAMAFFTPSAPSWSLDRCLRNRGGKPGNTKPSIIPRDLWGVAWAVAAIAYSYSGVTKMFSPGWISGDALYLILSGPLARPGFLAETLIQWPVALKFLTWGTLALEGLFAAFALFRRGRAVSWLMMVGLHPGILCTIQFAELSIGMLLIHILLFDPRWLRRSFWKQKFTATGKSTQGAV